MNTILEEIRKRIKAAIDDTDEFGPYDEYESGQRVGLATALLIIDEVEKEHPVPADVQEASEKYAAEQTPVEYPNLYGEDAIKSAYAAAMLAERERLEKAAVDGEIVKDIFGKLGVTAKVNLDGFKFGEKVRVIIEEIKEK